MQEPLQLPSQLAVQSAVAGTGPDPFADNLQPFARWQCPGAGSALLIVSTLVVATPLIEETVARGLVLGELTRRNCRFAVPLSAVLFAVLHRPEDIVLAFAFGMLAAHLLLGCKTLWSPIIAHGAFNALVLLDHYCLELPGLGQRLLAMSTLTRAARIFATVLVQWPTWVWHTTTWRYG